jgi:hypothetical protein
VILAAVQQIASGAHEDRDKGTAGVPFVRGAPMPLNRLTFAITASGVLAGSALCLVLAGPASADTTTPPIPTVVPSSVAATPSTPDVSLTVAPTPAATLPTAPGGPIEVPAGNARTTSSGTDATAITLLGAGGVLVAGGGVVAARRRA